MDCSTTHPSLVRHRARRVEEVKDKINALVFHGLQQRGLLPPSPVENKGGGRERNKRSE